MTKESVETIFCPPELAWTIPRISSCLTDGHSQVSQEEISKVINGIDDFKKLISEQERRIETRNLPSFEIDDLTRRLQIDVRALEFDGRELLQSIDNSLAKSVI